MQNKSICIGANRDSLLVKVKREIILMSQQEKPEEGQCLRSSSPVMKPLLFHMLMDASTIQEKKLRIPKKLVKRYRDKLPAVATLVLPCGDDWLVRLTVVDDKLWFTDGWHEFVVRYSICVGCLLLFKYEGDSIFKVSIFNLKSCEVDYIEEPKAAGKEKEFSVSNGKEIENNSCPPRLPFAIKKNVPEGGLDQKILCGNCNDTLKSMSNIDGNNMFLTKDADKCQDRPQSTRDVGIQFNGIEIDAVIHLPNQADIKQTKRRKQRNEPSNLVKEMEMPRSKIPRMESDASNVSTPERERTIQSAGKFKPSNPHCRIVMRRSFISNMCLHIPSEFSSKYLNEISEFITLEDSNGKQWPVRCLIQHNAKKLSQGWSHFVKDNHLEEGDVCVFELMEKKKVVLKVTIFRVSSHLVTSETKLQSDVQA